MGFVITKNVPFSKISVKKTIENCGPKPKEKKKYPTIIYCHAHGGNYSLGRDELIKGRKSLISDYASLLCSIGYAVLCLEMPCFGERQTPNESSLTNH